MAWHLREHQHVAHELGDLLYWLELEAPDVVYQSDGSLLGTIQYRGPDMESSDLDELSMLNARVHDIIQGFGAGWVLGFETRRHLAAAYPVSTWNHPVPALIDEEQRAKTGMPGTHFTTTYHVNLTYHLPSTTNSLWQNLWWKNIPKGHVQSNHVAFFQETLQRTCAAFHDVMEEADILTDNTLVSYLKSTVSLTPQAVEVPTPSWSLGHRLTDMELVPGAIPTLGDNYLRLLYVKGDTLRSGFPDTVYPGILDVLHDLPTEYRYTTRWIPLSRAAASKELRSLERMYRMGVKKLGTRVAERISGEHSSMVEGSAERAAAEASEARILLEEGTVTFGYLTPTICVWDKDFAIAEDKRKLVQEALQSKGFVIGCETLHSVESWLGMVPGDSYHNVRRPLMHSLNLAHMIATTSVWSGIDYVPHLNGPPLLVGTGKGHTHFGVSLHDGDVAETLLCGPKGSGKSSKVAMMAMGWQKYAGSRVIVYETGQSLRCATYAVGGTWINIAPGDIPALQPLVHIANETERLWASEWVGTVLMGDQIAVTATARKEIWQALTTLASFDTRHLTMTGLCGILQSRELREALEAYTVDGAYGSFVDGDTDQLSIADWQCFELETLIKNTPRLVPVVLPILFHRTDLSLDGRPTMIALDEVWQFFHLEVFVEQILRWVKEIRRKNGHIVFSMHNPEDMLQSRIGTAIYNECVTKIFCPNPRVLEPEISKVYTRCGVTQKEQELIAYAIPKSQFYFKGKKGSRLYQLDMEPVAKTFCGMSRSEDLTLITRIHSECTEPFSVALLKSQGLNEIAEELHKSTNEVTCYEKKSGSLDESVNLFLVG